MNFDSLIIIQLFKMFSRKFISSYSRVITKSHLTQSFQNTRSLHIAHHVRNINLKINYLGCYPSHSTVFNKNSIRFSSTSEVTKASVQDALPALPQIPDAPIAPEISEIVKEVSLATYNLGGYFPVGLTQHALYWIHNTCGMPWWATIIAGTAFIKIITFPVFLTTQRHQALIKIHQKDINYFERKKKEALAEGNSLRVQLYTSKQDKYYAENNMMTMKKTLMNYGIQGGVYFTFFMALSGMARAPVESMKEGGFLWITDLTIPDPYYLLPVIASLSSALFLQVFSGSVVGINTHGYGRYLKFVIPGVMLPIMLFFKTTVVLYVITSTWLMFISQAILRIPKFRAFFKFPPIIKPDPAAISTAKPLNFSVNEIFNTVKNSLGEIRKSRKLRNAYGLDQRKFDAAGRGPIAKTYKFDPTRVLVRKKNY